MNLMIYQFLSKTDFLTVVNEMCQMDYFDILHKIFTDQQ
jgi:hypothetical protein